MTKEELTDWALKNGWQAVGADLVLTKPRPPHDSIVRLVLKGTVVNLEIKKPIGKWEKVLGVPYGKIVPDEETGFPRGLGLDTISGFAQLMEDNKHRAVFAKMTGKPG